MANQGALMNFSTSKPETVEKPGGGHDSAEVLFLVSEAAAPTAATRQTTAPRSKLAMR